MPLKIDELRERLFAGKKKETDFYDSWAYLMLNYGWIPLDEFISMPSEVVQRLIEKTDEINKERSKKTKGGSKKK